MQIRSCILLQVSTYLDTLDVYYTDLNEGNRAHVGQFCAIFDPSCQGGRNRKNRDSLGARGGGPGRYTAGTSQGHGQCIHQKPTWYIANTFKIYQANFIAMFPVQEMLSTFTVFQVM